MKTKQLQFLSNWLLLILLSTQTAKGQNPPERYQPVFDLAEVLNDSQEQQIYRQLVDYEKKTSTQVVVYLVNTLDGETVERYANKLFGGLGIGQEGKDNGVLLLIAINDRKLRIETGYGTEAYITDSEADGIIRYQIAPAFKKKEYFTGISRAVDRIIAELEKAPYVKTEDIAEEEINYSRYAPFWEVLLATILVHLFQLALTFLMHKSDRLLPLIFVQFLLFFFDFYWLIIVSINGIFASTLWWTVLYLTLIFSYLQLLFIPKPFFRLQAYFWVSFGMTVILLPVIEIFVEMFAGFNSYDSLFFYIIGVDTAGFNFSIYNAISIGIFLIPFIFLFRALYLKKIDFSSSGGSYNYSSSGSSYNSSSSGGTFGGGSSSFGGGSSYSDYSDSSFGGGSSGGGGASGSW